MAAVVDRCPLLAERFDVDDAITRNLDLVRAVELACDEPALADELAGALRRVVVLDPTCGSGAFLLQAFKGGGSVLAGDCGPHKLRF